MKYVAQVLMSLALVLPAQGAAAENYGAEVETIITEIVNNHPNGQRIAQNEEFLAASRKLREVAQQASYTSYAMALGALFNSVNDGHTAAIPLYGDHPAFSLRFPLRVRRFHDGLYVIAAKGDATRLLGGRLTTINDTEIDTLVRQFASVSAGGNRAWPMNFVPALVATPGWLTGFGVMRSIEDPVVFRVEFPDGSTAWAEVRASQDGSEHRQAVERRQTEVEQRSSGRENFWYMRGCQETSSKCALVIHLATMGDEEGQSFRAFAQSLEEQLSDPDLDRLVIDIRTNGGGNNELAEPLRRQIIRSRFSRYGGIYVLTSPNTFSAAMNFATRLERDSDAIFVGEPTGSSPNHFGDAEFRTAKISRIPYIISTLRWQDSEPFDDREWILPDIPKLPAYEDYIAGIDRTLDAAVDHDGQDPRSREQANAEIARPWDRASQSVGWKFFHEAD